MSWYETVNKAETYGNKEIKYTFLLSNCDKQHSKKESPHNQNQNLTVQKDSNNKTKSTKKRKLATVKPQKNIKKMKSKKADTVTKDNFI